MALPAAFACDLADPRARRQRRVQSIRTPLRDDRLGSSYGFAGLPRRRVLSFFMAAALAVACNADDAIVEYSGYVAVAVRVESGGVSLPGATIDVVVAPGSFPGFDADSRTLLSDVQGVAFHLFDTGLVDTLVIVRVAVTPPPGSGLTGATDSAITRMYLSAPPPDTVRFLISL